MKIGILGGEGFIGKELVRVISSKHKVYSITRDNYEQHKQIDFDYFINANGNSKKYLANKNPLWDFDMSIRTVYESFLDFNFRNYIYLSSVDTQSEHYYGKNKVIAEDIVVILSLLKKIKHVYFRLGAVIGKGMKKGVLYDILNNIPLKVTRSSTYHIITNTEIAKILLKVCSKPNLSYSEEGFILAGTKSISINRLEELTKKTLKFEKKLEKQQYNLDLAFEAQIFNLKTSEEYVKDVIND